MAVIIFIIIGIIIYHHAKESERKRKEEFSKKYRQQRMWDLIEECWNDNTRDFNWRLWLDEKDIIFYDDSDWGLALKKEAQSELQNLGKAQIALLNVYLEQMKYENKRAQAVRELKAREPIILELADIFAQPFSYASAPKSKLLNQVYNYRQDLYDYILYRREPLSQQKLANMIKRGYAIMDAHDAP